jgi:hypothetical protein
MKPAKIETEKILVGETPCRRIIGFQDICDDNTLPDGYINKAPSFTFMSGGSLGGDQAHIWNGTEYKTWMVPRGTPLIITNLPEKHGIPGLDDKEFDPYIYIGDVLREDTFQAILVWLKRAGARLGKIRKNEKAGWAGNEMVTI